MCVATILRLVPEEVVPKALAIVFGAVSAATVVAAPLSSFLGNRIGWRNVFLSTAGLGIAGLFWQTVAVPSMPRQKPAALGTILLIMKRPGMKMGMLAVMLIFAGYGMFFTYLRPFLETITGVNNRILTVVLLGFSLANLRGTTLGRFPLEKNMYRTLLFAALILGCIVGLIVLFKHKAIVVFCLVALWGLFFGVLQIGWNMWITKVVPDEAESGGGALVAIIQFGIMTGAAAGGYFYDTFGGQINYLFGSLVAVGAALVSMVAFRQQNRASAVIK